jgi:histidine triad (HIT) family protein
MQEPSIFTKIINGEIPSYRVYEDEKTLAFLDIHPAAEGHTLVVPKVEVEFVWDLDEENYAALMATARKVALRLREVIGTPYVGESVVGTDIPHAHVHIVPFTVSEEIHAALKNRDDIAPNHEALAALAQKLAF